MIERNYIRSKRNTIIKILVDSIAAIIIIMAIALCIRDAKDYKNRIYTIEYFRPDGTIMIYENASDVYTWGDRVEFRYNDQDVRIEGDYILYAREGKAK